MPLPELEALHAPDEWYGRRIPGLGTPKPWRLLTLSVLIGGSVGFALTLVWHLADTRWFRLQPTRTELASPRVHEPLPTVPRLEESRAVPERAVKPVLLERPARPPPEPEVIFREPEPGTAPGYIGAEVDSERAREFERKHSERKITPP